MTFSPRDWFAKGLTISVFDTSLARSSLLGTGLVFARLFHRIDHEHVDGGTPRVELEAELLLHRSDQRGLVARGGRGRRSGRWWATWEWATAPGEVIRKLEIEVISTLERRLVHDDAIERRDRRQAGNCSRELIDLDTVREQPARSKDDPSAPSGILFSPEPSRPSLRATTSA